MKIEKPLEATTLLRTIVQQTCLGLYVLLLSKILQ